MLLCINEFWGVLNSLIFVQYLICDGNLFHCWDAVKVKPWSAYSFLLLNGITKLIVVFTCADYLVDLWLCYTFNLFLKIGFVLPFLVSCTLLLEVYRYIWILLEASGVLETFTLTILFSVVEYNFYCKVLYELKSLVIASGHCCQYLSW